MSMRQRAAQCLAKEQLSGKSQSRLCSPARRWPGPRVRGHEEESGEPIRTSNSGVCSASARGFRSRESVKAWLQSSSSPGSEDFDDGTASPSSFGSLASSAAESIDHVSCSTQFRKVDAAGRGRARTISPPRRTANRNATDISRIDPAHYSGGSFLVLAFKNAQYRGSSTPPAFQYTSEDFREEQLESWDAEECASPESEFSVISEWRCVLVAANAAGMSNRDSSGNNSELETSGEVSNASEVGLESGAGNCFARPSIPRKSRRTLSMELPRVRRAHHRCASGDYGSSPVDKKQYTALHDARTLGRRQAVTDVTCGEAGSTFGPSSSAEIVEEKVEEPKWKSAVRRRRARASAEMPNPTDMTGGVDRGTFKCTVDLMEVS